jgi:tRNA threonylcarbamoyladenosine biosynthesis protein TsaB
MKTLAVETSSARGSVALLEDGRAVAERTLGEGSRHGRDLVPCIDAVLGADPGCVDLVAVSAVPGSYTGLRVGIAFATTYCVETDTPAVAVSSLDVVAQNVPGPGPVCVVTDARLGQVYAALYDAEGKKVLDDAAARPETVAARIVEKDTRIVGDALRRYAPVFAEAGAIQDPELWWPRAVHVGRLGRAKHEEQGGDDARELAPRYLRRPHAEVVWERSQNGSGPKSTSTR